MHGVPLWESDLRTWFLSPFSADDGAVPSRGPHVGCPARLRRRSLPCVGCRCVFSTVCWGTLGISRRRRVRCTVRDVRENSGPISPSEVASLHSSAGTLHCAGSQKARIRVTLAARHWLRVVTDLNTVLQGTGYIGSVLDRMVTTALISPLFFCLAVLAPP